MTFVNPQSTALVLIDLQKGVVGRTLAPRSADEVIRVSMGLADRFRAAGAPVVLVNVSFAKDFGDALKQPVDKSFPRPPGGFPEGWTELVDGLEHPGDIKVTKHQWGAFYGTDLDVQLRRRGIKTIVLGGIATNIGVESTARQAYERGYEVVIAEDTTAGMSGELHAFAVEQIFPLLSRVRSAADIEFSRE